MNYPDTKIITWIDDETGEKVGEAEYTRSDIAQAMVAAAYEDAADKCQALSFGWEDDENGYVYPSAEFCADHLRSNTPTNARAALDTMLAKAREDALREAAEVVNRNLGKPAHHAHGAILALIDRTAEGEKQ